MLYSINVDGFIARKEGDLDCLHSIESEGDAVFAEFTIRLIDGKVTCEHLMTMVYEFIVSYVPVILGGGIPMYPRAIKEAKLKLIEQKTYGQFVQIRYEIIREY